MPPRQITYMPLGSLPVAARNPKNHDLPGLVASLTRYGWVAPAIVDERTGRLVAGHGRREACIVLKQAGDPPPGGVNVGDDGDWWVPVVCGWSSRDDTEAEAYIVADNYLTEAGGWVHRTLASMLEDIVTADADLIETTGITYETLDELLKRVDPETLGEQDPDAPDPPAPEPAPEPADSPAEPAETRTCPECGHTLNGAPL